MLRRSAIRTHPHLMSTATTEPPAATADRPQAAPPPRPVEPVPRVAAGRRWSSSAAASAGMEAVKKFKGEDVDVTLIDRSNHHLFQPLLYQVATAGLTPANIARPLREIFRHQENVEVLLSEVRRIDVEARKVITEDLVVPYDFLILATGARHSYFGHDEWEKFAPGLKNLADAVEIRKRMLHRLRDRRKGRRPGRARRRDDLRDRRRRADGRGNGRGDQRDRPAHDDARFPAHQLGQGQGHHHRGRAAHPGRVPAGPRRPAASGNWSRSASRSTRG